MARGRIVRVRADSTKESEILSAFHVGIEDEDLAIAAVLKRYPELSEYHIEAADRLSTTAVSFLELQDGEIRNRLARAMIDH